MKDLLVYVADADTSAFMQAILVRHHALKIRAVTFDIKRHPQRDAGMIQSGAELVRMEKGRYGKALLLWDHHGSGRDHRQSEEVVAAEIQDKLDRFSWFNHSAVMVLAPELEGWLWFCEEAVASHCTVAPEQLRQWLTEYANKSGRGLHELKTQQPKELFEHVMRERLRRTISPRDFEMIGNRASVNALTQCDSFREIVKILQSWFPCPCSPIKSDVPPPDGGHND